MCRTCLAQEALNTERTRELARLLNTWRERSVTLADREEYLDRLSTAAGLAHYLEGSPT